LKAEEEEEKEEARLGDGRRVAAVDAEAVEDVRGDCGR